MLLGFKIPLVPPNIVEKSRLEENTMWKQIDIEKVKEALWNHSLKRDLRLDNIRFKTLRILWKCKGEKYTVLTKRVISYGYYFRNLKTAKGVVI